MTLTIDYKNHEVNKLAREKQNALRVDKTIKF